jgi:hypothetical protein
LGKLNGGEMKQTLGAARTRCHEQDDGSQSE